MLTSAMPWIPVLSGLQRFRDSCNVYALDGPGGTVIVDAGTGRWLDHLDELPGGRPVALLCTHYFRDHSAGAVAASRAGIPVHVPHGERALFTDPGQHFRQRDTQIIYDNLWDLFAPIEGIAVAGSLRDYDRVTLGGLEFEVIPLPGATVTQVGFGVTLRGKRIVFCAEAIHSPGRLPRIAPLQYNYNDLGGAAECYRSAHILRERCPDALLPSLGDPMVGDADAALAKLQESLRVLCAGRMGMTAQLDLVHADPLERVTDHVWRDALSWSHTWYLISRSGRALAIDYGYDLLSSQVRPAYSKPERRRALLHGLEGLKRRFGIARPDAVLVSHFHDDHVCGIPILQRLFGTECWAAGHFAEILEHPEGSAFPCTWPEPIRVHRRLPVEGSFQWEEFTFHLHPMSGHTRFASLIGFEADGKRFAHTGDQYFFKQGGDPRWVFPPDGKWSDLERFQNHVYRNGALLDGYDLSDRWLLDWRPDIVLQGHQPAFFTDNDFFRHIEQWGPEYKEIHRRTMVLGEDEAHFNLDSWGGWIWPYRTHLPAPAPVKVRVTLRNPFPHAATLEARLVGPAGWVGGSARLASAARAEVSCEMEISPSGNCRRQPIAVELRAEGRDFGQVAEALVTVGGAEF